MKILKQIIDKYSNHEYIDIEEIVGNLWIKINYIDFETINWIIIWRNIWINKNISLKKQRFTIAHELCHFLLKEKWASTWLFACQDLREKRADDFATKLLLPKKIILEAYKEFWNIPTISEMFWVPGKVIEKRLNSLLNN